MTNDEILTDVKDSFEFLGNKNKAERDKFVVRNFLKILMVDFDDSDLHAPSEYNPADIRFDGAEFQIKEILDHGRLRNKEYKEAYNNASAILVS